MSPEMEDVAELLQHIQSRLLVKEAARTSVLSKSWLHAWSTIPTLSFEVRRGKQLKLVDVERILERYLRDNIPIEKFDLKIDIEDPDSASHAEKLIRPVATRTRLKEISLSIVLWGASFTLPDEILASENLTKMRVLSPVRRNHSVWMPDPVIINCVSLRTLYLDGVRISEEALHGILSSCRLLETIQLLYCCNGFETIKVTNLPRLWELEISLEDDDGRGHSTALEISDVPNLVMLSYDVHVWGPQMPLVPFNSHSVSFGGRSRVRQLMLGGVIKDNECLQKIKSGFPFLQRLTLEMTSWGSGSFHFTCASLKRLSLLSCPSTLIDVQVYAPKLLFFNFGGDALPSLLFPVSKVLKKTEVSLMLRRPVDVDFFLRMREALTLSSKCDIHISANNSKLPLDINIDDLRTRLVFPPATNVQQVQFETIGDECLWERSPFFDAFFEICHPKHVLAKRDARFRHNNHFCRLMLREVLLEKKAATQTVYNHWPHHLKHVQIRQSHHQNWETLTNSHTGFLDGSAAPGLPMHFKLNWGGVS